uniref:Cytochrome P450 n=1 Tax=Kwoniella bestiolae CBS 10118 TaxID=1296100 RepID=A0A1B9FRS6_9TREE|nr:hypothetical protein I302_09131 [Kwoniella bestiolae CBS 10118]OCF21452.1 hypothetical protein I302_09131 [Kwoniella bestiolae CBS 10118]
MMRSIDLVDGIRLPTPLEMVSFLVILLLVYLIDTFLLKPWTSPLRHLEGPPRGYGMNGHSVEIMNLHGNTVHEWISTYGSTFLVRGPFGVHHRIFTLDPRALSHVLNNTQIYFKSPILRNLVRRYMKEGLIVAEGERHKVQRKVAQRLFSRNGLKGMSEIVEEKANQLRDIFHDLLSNPHLSTPYSPCSNKLPPGSREIDIYASASRCTFDIIGQVGIDHTFNSAGEWEGEGGRLFDKYERMQYPTNGLKFLMGLLWPCFEKVFPSENAKLVAQAMDPLEDLSKKIMNERQREIDEGKRELPSDNRDLLTLMLRCNMTKGLNPDQKLRDHEITGQLATFMFAGSDTTAGTIAMGLYQLAKHPYVQETLRAELSAYGDNLPYEQIDELPYLDAVVKEVLRINPSLPGTVRQAQRDDIIPLSQPLRLTSGKAVTELKIRKGQMIHVPIEHLHTSSHIWGADANSFDPSRFLGDQMDLPFRTDTIPRKTSIPSSVPPGPGVWPNFMTFIDGPRRCVGYKLALMEIKIMFFKLIREFQVLPKDDQRVWRMSTRPYVEGTLFEKGSSLPIIIRHLRGEEYEEGEKSNSNKVG